MNLMPAPSLGVCWLSTLKVFVEAWLSPQPHLSLPAWPPLEKQSGRKCDNQMSIVAFFAASDIEVLCDRRDLQRKEWEGGREGEGWWGRERGGGGC